MTLLSDGAIGKIVISLISDSENLASKMTL
jgi:hypothetical protein